MRIIAGRLKGRRLDAPKGLDVRPTSDGLRETLFNVLGESVQGARVLDGFAGTGALGLEAWSRGAAAVVFVEHDARALRALESNIRAMGIEAVCAVVRREFLTARIEPPVFDLVLLDPPYALADMQAVVDRGATFTARGGRLVLEHSRRRESPERAGALMRYRVLVAGDSALSFYATPTDPPRS
jgi:16S rRNA (guanine(966)-N(2))-methyltransferase RsmD